MDGCTRRRGLGPTRPSWGRDDSERGRAESLDPGPVRRRSGEGNIVLMNTHSTASKVLLVADPPAAAKGGVPAPIRRYRIARVRPENRPLSGGGDTSPTPPRAD